MVLTPTPSTLAPNPVVAASTDYTGVIIAIIVIIILIIIAIVVICVLVWYRRRRSYAPYAAHTDDNGKRVEYKSNYCTEPTPDTICYVEEGEVAVVMTGVMYPDVIESVNCACPNNDYNLQLKRAYDVTTFQITHEFVCSMRTCNMNTSNRRVCRKIKKDETTEYRCTCPEEYECRMEPSARKGYCERRVEM
ncbi:Hypothetical predicted protein [Mytilus galloprovincialis]|uniref:Cytochrome c oxidase polypeptide II n=1 Tax=Mytilus galloprovincialis TaxID=29158 RepID=A0A8B6H2Z0_MYTGA|nr:Hypothetical predicted protein [Mytilus galloprovincialis]